MIVSDLEIAIASPSFASLLLSDTCGKLSYLPHSMGPPIPQFCHFHSAQAPVSKVALNRYNMITHATITKHPHVPRSPCFGDDDDHYDITMQLIYKILPPRLIHCSTPTRTALSRASLRGRTKLSPITTQECPLLRHGSPCNENCAELCPCCALL